MSEASPAEDIQLTRALVLAGTIQAAQFLNDPLLLNTAGSYMLAPFLQKFLVQKWLPHQPSGRYPKAIIPGFNDEQSIASKSGGKYKPYAIFKEYTEMSSQTDSVKPSM